MPFSCCCCWCFVACATSCVSGYFYESNCDGTGSADTNCVSCSATYGSGCTQCSSTTCTACTQYMEGFNCISSCPVNSYVAETITGGIVSSRICTSCVTSCGSGFFYQANCNGTGGADDNCVSCAATYGVGCQACSSMACTACSQYMLGVDCVSSCPINSYIGAGNVCTGILFYCLHAAAAVAAAAMMMLMSMLRDHSSPLQSLLADWPY